MKPFSILVIGDTQYLFDGARKRPGFLLDTFRHASALAGTGAVAPIRHVIHVGDVTEHGWADEAEAAESVLQAGAALLRGTGMTIATGNHDIAQYSDDTRGETDFSRVFGPASPLLGGNGVRALRHGPGGYSSWREVEMGDGASIGVLALDWRPSAAGWRWADDILSAHPDLPTIVVSHETAFQGELTPHGDLVKDLMAPHPQAFLALGGHEWPSTRVSQDGREYHAVNYQELPFGGAGAGRIYEFDPGRGTCQVISFCPAAERPEVLRSVEARRRLALARPEDQFAFDLPASLGGRSTPWQAEGLALIADTVPNGETEITLRLDGAFVLEIEAELPPAIPDSWQVLLTRLGTAPDGSPEALAALSLSTENFIGWMAYTQGGETWTNSHEYQPSQIVSIVIAQGATHGAWIDGDPVGRVDGGLAHTLLDGPWRWRLGSGEYGGEPADPFGGTVRRLRAWA